MDSLWMAPWDAGGTFRIGSRPEVAIHTNILRCVVQLSRRPVFPAAGYFGFLGGLARTCVKVRSVPKSRCIRVVAPDGHVNIGFHEMLLHDMEDEDRLWH